MSNKKLINNSYFLVYYVVYLLARVYIQTFQIFQMVEILHSFC